MTVITKAMGEKKASDKMDQPLVVDSTSDRKIDPEAQRDVPGHYLILRTRVMRFHNMPTICLFLTAILVMGFGIMGGVYIYRQYARAQMHRFRTGWYSIPYDTASKAQYTADVSFDDLSDSDLFRGLTKETEQAINNKIKNFFKERFEIDLENELYEKIDVPDFRGGRRGRIIHDFSTNKTGIIDIDGGCCFVMPLDREKVLPPKNMYDLLSKMHDGSYEVDTKVVRETMRVTFPPIIDFSNIGTYITRECQDRDTYLLKKADSDIVKRSVSTGVFGQFAVNKIIELDILNLDSVLDSNPRSRIHWG